MTCYVTVIPYCQPAVSLANVHTSYQTHASFRCRPCFVLHTNKVNCGFDSIYWRSVFLAVARFLENLLSVFLAVTRFLENFPSEFLAVTRFPITPLIDTHCSATCTRFSYTLTTLRTCSSFEYTSAIRSYWARFKRSPFVKDQF